MRNRILFNQSDQEAIQTGKPTSEVPEPGYDAGSRVASDVPNWATELGCAIAEAFVYPFDSFTLEKRDRGWWICEIATFHDPLIDGLVGTSAGCDKGDDAALVVRNALKEYISCDASSIGPPTTDSTENSAQGKTQ